MGEANYKLRLKKGDFEVEVQGDKDFVIVKFEELTKGKIALGKIGQPAMEETAEFPDSLVEFVKQKGDPKEHVDLVIIFAYWLFKKENMDSFNIKDIESRYSRAVIPKPANLSDKIYRNQAKGFLVRAEAEKDGLMAFRITRSGEEHVEKMKAS